MEDVGLFTNVPSLMAPDMLDATTHLFALPFAAEELRFHFLHDKPSAEQLPSPWKRDAVFPQLGTADKRAAVEKGKGELKQAKAKGEPRDRKRKVASTDDSQNPKKRRMPKLAGSESQEKGHSGRKVKPTASVAEIAQGRLLDKKEKVAKDTKGHKTSSKREKKPKSVKKRRQVARRALIHKTNPRPADSVKFDSLLEDFGFSGSGLGDATSDIASDQHKSEVVGHKRRKIELIQDVFASTAITMVGPKPKAAKKKAQTITEKATAPFVTAPEISNDVANLKPVVQKAEPPKRRRVQYSKIPRKLTSTKSSNKTKCAEAAPPPPPPLLSPETAISKARGQDLVFGTSSQLVREESPTQLRDLRFALQESEALQQRLTDRYQPRLPRGRMWEASAQREADETTKSLNELRYFAPGTIIPDSDASVTELGSDPASISNVTDEEDTLVTEPAQEQLQPPFSSPSEKVAVLREVSTNANLRPNTAKHGSSAAIWSTPKRLCKRSPTLFPKRLCKRSPILFSPPTRKTPSHTRPRKDEINNSYDSNVSTCPTLTDEDAATLCLLLADDQDEIYDSDPTSPSSCSPSPPLSCSSPHRARGRVPLTLSPCRVRRIG